jgi:hypothetical protein
VSTLTAHVGYSVGPGRFGQAREVYHAVADRPVPVSRFSYGDLVREPGEALCGAAPVTGCPPGLFAPVVSCPACLAIAARAGVTLAGAA